MTRFCKQRDRYSCGPVALLNIDKHFGRQATYKDLPRYRKRVRCKYPSGTYTRAISKVLGRATRRSFKKAKQFLQDGNCIVVQTKRKKGHYYLVMIDRLDLGIVNIYQIGPCIHRIAPQELGSKLKNSYRTWYVKEATGIL